MSLPKIPASSGLSASAVADSLGFSETDFRKYLRSTGAGVGKGREYRFPSLSHGATETAVRGFFSSRGVKVTSEEYRAAVAELKAKP